MSIKFVFGKKCGFGCGFDVLLGLKGVVMQVQVVVVIELQFGEILCKLLVGQLQFGKYQLCCDMDEIKLGELVDLICLQGVIQLILVCQFGVDSFEIVVGECCWCVLQLVGLDEVFVVVCELEDCIVIVMVLIENIQCEDFNLFEEVEVLQWLIIEFVLIYVEVVQVVGWLWVVVFNLLCLFELLIVICLLLEICWLEMGYVCVLLMLVLELVSKLVQEVVDEGWLVCEVEYCVQQFVVGKVFGVLCRKLVVSVLQVDIVLLEIELFELLGVCVVINYGCGGKGKLIIYYIDLDMLDGVFE